jgi:CRISPR-associated endonuclease/helicase Cas3
LLDEVQNIPYKYWELIKIILKELSEVLDCYIVLITATMPLIYDEEKNEIKELIPNKKDYFEYFDRIVLDVSNLEKEMTLLEFKSFIEFELLKYPEKNFLIVLNTIKTSIDIYQYIESLIEKDIIFGNPMYLSSNIIPKERKDRIKNIKTKGEKRKIIVSTQVIEAGVDIDLDRVYRDIAPLDSINQTCGRCNRNFSSEKGVVTIFKLVQDNSKNNTYAGYVYSNALIQKTERILLDNSEKGVIDEKNFYELNKKYFNVLNDYKSNDTSNEILEKIKTLMYEKAFFGSNERNGEEPFKLIDEIDSVNLFIELDEVAISLWATYETIFSKKMNNFSDAKKRKEEYSKIKSNFLNYVITIPRKVAEKQLPGENLDNLFNRVPKELIKTAYLKDTGFIRNETNQNYFF